MLSYKISYRDFYFSILTLQLQDLFRIKCLARIAQILCLFKALEVFDTNIIAIVAAISIQAFQAKYLHVPFSTPSINISYSEISRNSLRCPMKPLSLTDEAAFIGS